MDIYIYFRIDKSDFLMLNKRHFIFLVFLTAFLQLMYSNYTVSYFTADNGLSRNYVNHIFRDSKGFIWISTSSGIDRFDGYDFLHFSWKSKNTDNLLKFVNCIEEDLNGDLWIGSENGLFIYEYKTGHFHPISDKFNTGINYNEINIKLIKRDENGKMWVVHNSGLSYFTLSNSGELSESLVVKSTTVETVQFMNNSIYVGDDHTVYRLIADNNGEYKKVDINESLLNLTGQVNALFIDRNYLWVGTSTGLLRYNFLTEEIKTFVNISGDQTSLSSNTITEIAKNQDNEIFVATLIGLNIYNYNTDKFTRINTETFPRSNALNNNFISSLLIFGKTIWIGTEKGGVNLLRPQQDYFTNVSHPENDPSGLSKNPVNALYEDKDGDLFIGTVEGGLNIRKKGSTGFIHSVTDPGNLKSLQHNSVSTICEDYNSDLWIGTWGGGISRLKNADKFNPVFQRLNIASEKSSVSSYFVAAIIPDNANKGLWIGTRDGLDFFSIPENKYYTILNNLPTEKSIRLITGLCIDSENRLWVGTGNGLFCIYLNQSDIRRNTYSYRHFHYLMTNPDSKIVEKINCIYEAKDKTIWLGSNGNGLYSIKNKSDKLIIKNFDEKNGLTDNVIYGILEDAAGTLWFSTDKGISAFIPKTKHFRNFTVVDGLASNQFYWDAFLKGQDGKMYFGHLAGYTMFDPLKFLPATVQNSVEITKISVLNETVYPFTNSEKRKFLHFDKKNQVKLVLKESDKAFSVEFSALNYSFPDKIKYAYRLKGFEKAWKEVPADRRFANFTNIGHGNYELEIKCTNSDGTWSDKISVLKLKVVPPFYKMWWFILIVILLSIYFIFSYYKLRIKNLREQEKHLKQIVETRTREIEEQKKQLELQAQQLKSNMDELIAHQDEVSRQNEKLINQNFQITQQNEELEKLTRKLEDATIDKIAFFTNITHEFRTPITLILGPVERALKLSINPKVLEQLDIVRRNSKLLLTLVNQLMDFRKVESGKMELAKANLNFIEFLKMLFFLSRIWLKIAVLHSSKVTE